MTKSVLIVGGGTAGWITAGYLASIMGTRTGKGVKITLVESPEIGIIGVGEGTFPTIRKTLSRIGVPEEALIRECHATFKQGARFAHWRYTPGQEPVAGRDHYLHSFAVTQARGGLDLLPYWLLGVAGDINWDEVNTLQKIAADAQRAPKRIVDPDYQAPLNYAFHFDAPKLADLLKRQAIGLGVQHISDTVDAVHLSEDGSIDRLTARGRGDLRADLYVDCTGFRAQLIGQAMGVPYKPCRDVLFCNKALAMQVPYDRPDAPVASYTISTAHEAGWTWDIGLDNRRGVGYVYSTDHTTDDRAEEVLRAYVGPAAKDLTARALGFTAGFREINWHKNCVAIGLSSGFFEPLEATGIVFSEVAAVMLANLFPWNGSFETSARQFNDLMLKRYRRALDFIKLHYCISERRDSDFWKDNVSAATIPDSLHELLDRWRFRPPGEIDIDPNIDIFPADSWQYVLYGMGWKTDLSAQADIFRFYREAADEFADIRQQAANACRILPSNRDLIEDVKRRGFRPNQRAMQ